MRAADAAMGPGERPKGPPDFEQTVKLVLATFAVFTGFAIGKAVESVASRIAIPSTDPSLVSWGWLSPLDALWTMVGRVFGEPYFWALIALLSLFLRFLIGSAVHLNDTYVKRVDRPGAPVSQVFALLFKDLMFLVAFGIAALLIAKTVTTDTAGFDVKNFAFGSMLFLVGGLSWSLIDLISRWWVGRTYRDEWRGAGAYARWPVLDAIQLFGTWFYVWVIALPLGFGVLAQIVPLAVFFACFLYLDIDGLIRGLRPELSAPAGPPLTGLIEFDVDQTTIDDNIAAGSAILREAHARGMIVIDPRNTGQSVEAELARALFDAMAAPVRVKLAK
jgi:hypothetical protein